MLGHRAQVPTPSWAVVCFKRIEKLRIAQPWDCWGRICVAAPAQGHARAFHGHRDSVALAAPKPPSERFHSCTETLFHILLNFIYIKLKIYF